jgi:hypothetical protein
MKHRITRKIVIEVEAAAEIETSTLAGTSDCTVPW